MLAWTELSVAVLVMATGAPASPVAPTSLAAPTSIAVPPSLAASPSSRAAADPASTISGVVVDAGSERGIGDVTVALTGTDFSTTTDRDGHFALPDVPKGQYEMAFSRLGYHTRRDSINVQTATDLILRVQLSEEAVPLAPIQVLARPSKLMAVGFYDRRKHGMGTYFTRGDIEKDHVRRLSDLLAGVAGLRRTVRSDGTSRIDIRGVKTFFTNCGTQYFIDGVQAQIGSLGVDIIPIRDVEGVEIYRGSSELPMQYNVGSAMCGAVLIWTRDGGGR